MDSRFFPYLRLFVPFLLTDDWFKRLGALQRLCMTSEEILSLAGVDFLCACVTVCVVCTAQISRQAVLTGMWIVRA